MPTPETNDDLASAYRGRRVCVTGGAGFIGSHLSLALARGGAEVCVLDDLSNGLETNLAEAPGRVRLVRGSVLDRAKLGSAVNGSEVVFHLAAVASVPRSVEEPERAFAVNAAGTLEVLEAARLAGVGRVVYAASSSAYGDQPGLPRVETMAPDIRSPYAAAKCTGEHLVHSHARCYDLSAVSLRYFNIFGPRQREDSPYAAVIPRFIRALLDGKSLVIYGDGRQTRDFTPVANAVRANLLAGSVAGPLRGEVVNVACGRSTTVLELVAALGVLLSVEPAYTLAPSRAGEVRDSLASIDAARELIGYEPVVSFEDGLRDTVGAWCR